MDKGEVVSLAFGNGVLYVAGGPWRDGRVVRDNVAALDPRTGKLTPWRVNLPPALAGIEAITTGNGVVYISSGGAAGFKRVDGLKRPLGIAAVSPRTGRPTAWSPKHGNEPDDAYSILATHGQVLVGGKFGFAVYDARTGSDLRWRNHLSGSSAVANEFAISGNTVYLAAGTAYAGFNRAGGKRVNNLAAVRLPEGTFTDWRPILGRCVDVSSIAVSADKVLVGGVFSQDITGCVSPTG